jgi:hypothetical protein
MIPTSNIIQKANNEGPSVQQPSISCSLKTVMAVPHPSLEDIMMQYAYLHNNDYKKPYRGEE